MGTNGPLLLTLSLLLAALQVTSASWRSPYSGLNSHPDSSRTAATYSQDGQIHHRSREAVVKQTAFQWSDTNKASRQSAARLRSKGLKTSGFYYSRVFYVTDNGADPSGNKDSTEALQKTINDAFGVGSNHTLSPGITDLGGVEIHLEGGDYLISAPLQFSKSGGGNLLIHGGTLRASSSFPTDRYLLELWSEAGKRQKSNRTVASLRDRNHHTLNCLKDYVLSYEDITLRDLMFDANFRGGGLMIVNSARITIDNVYMSHFATDGLLVEGSREIYVRNSYFGQFISTGGGDRHEEDFTGVAINLISNDNVMSNVVIFSAGVGVQVSGQGNILTGVHAYNKRTAYGGIGIYLQLPGYSQTRILNCYLDSTGIVADDPAQLEISQNYFTGDANVVLRSTRMEHSVEQVSITNNIFAGSWKGVPIVQLDQKLGTFAYVDRTIVDQNTAYGMNLKATVARATVSGYGKKFSADLSERLLFPDRIQNVQYSLFIPHANSYPKHCVRTVTDNRVVVETDCRVSGTLTVLVDQSSDILYTVGSVSL